MRSCLLVGLALFAGGCAHTPEAIRAREAERLERARCATVELYQFGITPPKRYRIMGPIAVDYDWIPSHVDRALQERACEIGADAVIDIRETELTARIPFTDGAGYPPMTTTSGTAVAFLADDPAP